MRIPAAAGVHVTAKFPVRKVCPFRDEADVGRITLIWFVDGVTLELHALGEWLGEWADCAISHEDFTRQVKDHLLDLGVAVIDVVSEWETAGAHVSVAA